MTDLTEQWVNIYKSKRLGGYWSGAFCYKTKKEAVKNLADKEHYLTTVNIEDVLNLQAQNAQLKELLKEWAQFEKEENPNDFTVISERMSELANKTNQALGEDK